MASGLHLVLSLLIGAAFWQLYRSNCHCYARQLERLGRSLSQEDRVLLEHGVTQKLVARHRGDANLQARLHKTWQAQCPELHSFANSPSTDSLPEADGFQSQLDTMIGGIDDRVLQVVNDRLDGRHSAIDVVFKRQRRHYWRAQGILLLGCGLACAALLSPPWRQLEEHRRTTVLGTTDVVARHEQEVGWHLITWRPATTRTTIRAKSLQVLETSRQMHYVDYRSLTAILFLVLGMSTLLSRWCRRERSTKLPFHPTSDTATAIGDEPCGIIEGSR